MPPTPPARRPRPGPGRAAGPATPRPLPLAEPVLRSGIVHLGDEELRVPGFAALLRRHPRLARHGALGAIAAGIALFAVAGLTTPLAGADVAQAPTPTPTPPASSSFVPAPAPLALPAPSRKVLTATPVHAKKPAPANHGVISGLAANGIPEVALNAYRVAAARMASAEPSCGIDWALLAGIGREESDHGQFGGAVLHADGVSTPAIIGPALDGVHWDYVPAPADGMQLDGDAVYAHALGPMQFIPSTWAIYGISASGNGPGNVFNINDAALGAARYLCAAGGDLRTAAGQTAAVLAYNHSDQYLAQVLALAAAYRAGIPVTGIPVGVTSGALPPVDSSGSVPPVNPGGPTAVDGTTKSGKPSATHSPSPSRTTTPSHSGSAPGSSSHASTPPSSGSSTPGHGGSSSTPPSSGSGSSSKTPTPTPTPSPSCNPVEALLGICKAASGS